MLIHLESESRKESEKPVRWPLLMSEQMSEHFQNIVAFNLSTISTKHPLPQLNKLLRIKLPR